MDDVQHVSYRSRWEMGSFRKNVLFLSASVTADLPVACLSMHTKAKEAKTSETGTGKLRCFVLRVVC